MNITQILSQELSATTAQINAAIELSDDGATVPFIARYRKEATGGLDDTQLRQLAERLQTVFARDLRLGAAFGLVGQIQVFQRGFVVGGFDLCAEIV